MSLRRLPKKSTQTRSTDADTPVYMTFCNVVGGVISPVIANMVLDRLEVTLQTVIARRGACINVIRYADDFIITGSTPEILMEEVKPLVETFLGRRGLRLSEEKTHLRSIEEGFDFLGFTVRKYDKKLLIKPSRDKVASFLKRIRDYIKSNVSVQADRFLRGLNSRLRGFANFYRHVVSKKTFSEIDRQVYQLLRNWMLRRHRNKTLAWCKRKYIKRWGTRWQFIVSVIKEGKVTPIRLFKVADLPIIRHIKVLGSAHPYDPFYAEYFEQRRNRQWLRRKKDSRFLAVPAIERMV